jgi:aquaporin Z
MNKYIMAFLAELIGTLLLIAVGLSIVILMFGSGSPMIQLIPSAGIRRLIAGFLFGSTGALIALSLLGKISGAHINPVVTLAFLLKGKMTGTHAAGYFIAQMVGASLGAIPLLLWGNMGKSISYGATFPGINYSPWLAVLGEAITTFALILGLLIFIGHKKIRSFTPLLFPFLYCVMVYLEAPISGTSTNPARSFGPSLVANNWQGWWIYWLGPAVGMLIALLVHRYSRLNVLEAEVAKLYHFNHDPKKIFRK